MDYFNQDGHLTEEGIALYAEALQTDQLEQLPEHILHHIEACVACHSEALALYGLLSEVDRAGQEKQLEEKPSGRVIPMRIFRWAMVAVLAGLSFYFYHYLDRSPSGSILEQDRPVAEDQLLKDSLPGIAKEETLPSIPKKESTESPTNTTIPKPGKNHSSLYAANFVPSGEMERLLASRFRSSGLRLIEPQIKDTFGLHQNISFEWSGEKKEDLFLQVENNRGEEVYQQKLSDLKLDLKADLEPGIYYWRLESEEDLIMLGRLVLK